MSIWHPSAITFDQYLQANSFVRDITGQVKSSSRALEVKVSDQTKALVANHQQLVSEFGSGFNSINSTLEWGFNKIEYILQDVNASIDSLHADFNYSMGLLLEEVHINNRLLTDLLGKIDAIHRTLESPTLTQAREFYKIGCERLSKGLLDKALEAFTEAEKKNDTDFFTQFQIGKLYLYGIDDDDNVFDLQKAKKHLLLASRFAKAEITVDKTFARFAAEALLHASIAIYAQLGEKNILSDDDKTRELLEEAKTLTSQAAILHPELSECFYHTAKYCALLNEAKDAIPNLETAIIADRDYAVKVDVDHAFDSIRPHVLSLLSKLKDASRNQSYDKLKRANQLLSEVSPWFPEESGVLGLKFFMCKDKLAKAQSHFETGTYFGLRDSISLLDPLIISLPQLKTKRIEELKNQIFQDINLAKRYLPSKDKEFQNFEEFNYIAKRIEELKNRIFQDSNLAKSYLPSKDKESPNFENTVQEINDLISKAEYQLKLETYEAYKSARSLVNSAKIILSRYLEEKLEKDKNKFKEKSDRDAAKRLQRERNSDSLDYASKGAGFGGVIGFLSGFVSCWGTMGINGIPDWSNPFVFAFYGIIIGIVLGLIIGQMKQ